MLVRRMAIAHIHAFLHPSALHYFTLCVSTWDLLRVTTPLVTQ
jgi:hypothetical protein